MSSHSFQHRPGAGFLERHRFFTVLTGLLVVAVLGTVVGAGIALLLTKVVATAAGMLSSHP